MKSFVAVAILIPVFSTCAAASIQGSFDRTYQVSGAVDMEVFTHSGDITLRTGPAGTVKISGKIHVGDGWFNGNHQEEVSQIEKSPPIRQNGNSIRIENVDVRDVSVDYEITVPADTALRTHTGSGDQSIHGLNKPIELESGSGDMRLRELAGGVRLHTGSGDVEAREISGAFHAETGSGDIRLDEKSSGDVLVHTGSGDVELRGVNGSLLAETGSGEVRVTGTQNGTWELRTHSGNVEIQLPANSAFDLDATTASGEVVVDRPVTMIVQGRVAETRREVRGQVGSGGPRLIVHTGSGDVHIE